MGLSTFGPKNEDIAAAFSPPECCRYKKRLSKRGGRVTGTPGPSHPPPPSYAPVNRQDCSPAGMGARYREFFDETILLTAASFYSESIANGM